MKNLHAKEFRFLWKSDPWRISSCGLQKLYLLMIREREDHRNQFEIHATDKSHGVRGTYGELHVLYTQLSKCKAKTTFWLLPLHILLWQRWEKIVSLHSHGVAEYSTSRFKQALQSNAWTVNMTHNSFSLHRSKENHTLLGSSFGQGKGVRNQNLKKYALTLHGTTTKTG